MTRCEVRYFLHSFLLRLSYFSGCFSDNMEAMVADQGLREAVRDARRGEFGTGMQAGMLCQLQHRRWQLRGIVCAL